MTRNPLPFATAAVAALLLWRAVDRPGAVVEAPQAAEASRVADPGPAGAPAPGAGGVVVLDQAELLYPEDERGAGPRRALAQVGAVLERKSGEARLVLDLSATGSEVDPVPGFEGVAGHNRVTARELDRLTRERALGIATRGAGHAAREGSWRVARRGRLPERRLGRNGRIENRAAAAEELVLEIAADSGWLPEGVWRTEVLVGGRARLAATFEFDGEGGEGAGRIVALEALFEHPPGGGP